jgi:hypothetical protein
MKNVLNLIKHLYNEADEMRKSQGAGEEYLYLYVRDTSTQVRLSSQDGHTVKVDFIEELKGPKAELRRNPPKSPKEDAKEIEQQCYSYQLGSIYDPELKEFLDNFYLAREKNEAIRNFASSEEHLYDKYANMFKGFLKDQCPEGFTLVNKKEGKYEEWNIREESTGLIHNIFLGAAIENGDLPRTVLGSMKIMVRVDVNQVQPLTQVNKDSTTRTLYLDIPGYQLHEYKVLMDKNVKDPRSSQNEAEFFAQLKNAFTRSLSTKMQYMLLNDAVENEHQNDENKNQASKPPKI